MMTLLTKDQQLAVNRVAYSSKPMLCLADTINAVKASKTVREFSRMYESEPVVLDAEKIHDTDK